MSVIIESATTFVIGIGPPAKREPEELVQLYEKLSSLQKATPPQGLSIQFKGYDGGLRHIKMMAAWAEEDGYVLEQGTVHRKRRDVNLRAMTAAERKEAGL